MAKYEVYIGTYTEPIKFGTGEIMQGKGEGIHFGYFDTESRSLELLNATPSVNPSYLVLSEDRRYLYCVNETKQYQNMPGGSASAFAIEAPGKLRHLNTQATKGEDPCHIAIDQAGSHVFAANFMTGSMCMFPVKEDGSLEENSAFFQHEGSGPTFRQTGPHAHAVVLTPGERYALVPDLGIDQIVIYAYDAEKGALKPSGALPLKSGDGPRHCVFHPQKPDMLYVINELSLHVAVFKFDNINGTGTLVQEVPIVKASGEDSIGADIQISHDGRFLYASVRGNDIIAAYQIDPNTGHLSAPSIFSSGGKTPRSFAISPDDKFLIAGNQDTDNIVIFEIEQETGALQKVSEMFAPTPVCIKFV